MTKEFVWILFGLGLIVTLLPVLSWLGWIKVKGGERLNAFIPDDALVELAKKVPWLSALGLILIAYSIGLCSLLPKCFK